MERKENGIQHDFICSIGNCLLYTSTAVIFISDGDPTFYYNPDGYTRGDGNNDGNGGADNLKVCLDAAKNEIANLGVNYFYTVGVGKASDYVNLSDLCSASGVSGAKNFDGTRCV